MTLVKFDIYKEFPTNEDIILPTLKMDKVNMYFTLGDLYYSETFDLTYIFSLHSEQSVFCYFSFYLPRNEEELNDRDMKNRYINNVSSFSKTVKDNKLTYIGNLYKSDYNTLYKRLELKKSKNKVQNNMSDFVYVLLKENNNTLKVFMERHLYSFYKIEMFHKNKLIYLKKELNKYNQQIKNGVSEDTIKEEFKEVLDNIFFNYYYEKKDIYNNNLYIDTPIQSVFHLLKSNESFVFKFSDYGDLILYDIKQNIEFSLLSVGEKEHPYRKLKTMDRDYVKNNSIYRITLPDYDSLEYLLYID